MVERCFREVRVGKYVEELDKINEERNCRALLSTDAMSMSDTQSPSAVVGEECVLKSKITVADATDKDNYMRKSEITVADATDKDLYVRKSPEQEPPKMPAEIAADEVQLEEVLKQT